MANAIRAESPSHPTATRQPATNDAERINRADGARGLCVSMPGPLAQAGMNRAFGPRSSPSHIPQS